MGAQRRKKGAHGVRWEGQKGAQGNPKETEKTQKRLQEEVSGTLRKQKFCENFFFFGPQIFFETVTVEQGFMTEKFVFN